jgi:hypothetical protein
LRIVSKRQAVASVLVTLAVACGPGKSTDPAAGTPKASNKDATDAGAGGSGGSGGSGASGSGSSGGHGGSGASEPAADAGAAAGGRPFAGSPQEATALIGAAIDKKAAEIQKCVIEYRARKKLPRERVTITMGIDQEGRLLGATLPKGKTDAPLSECVLAAMANAPFPRSHSGVISISKSYEEVLQ